MLKAASLATAKRTRGAPGQSRRLGGPQAPGACKPGWRAVRERPGPHSPPAGAPDAATTASGDAPVVRRPLQAVDCPPLILRIAGEHGVRGSMYHTIWGT